MNNPQTSRAALGKLVQYDFRGYPVITVAVYGPTASHATKLAVSACFSEKDTPDVLERWFSEERDVRDNIELPEKILQFTKKHQGKSLAMVDRISGCPHEEGIDYPEGKSCPQCPYGAGRDPATGERVH